MPHPFARTEILLGASAVANLRDRHVLLAGVGGVGGYVAENLARAGIGHITLIDHDVVGISNINRQIVALHSTLDQPKVAVMAARIRDIFPDCVLETRQEFISADNATRLLADSGAEMVVDCIDAIACKAILIQTAQTLGLPVFSSMGAGNRLDPRRVRVARLNQTEKCPLARELRALLRKNGASLDVQTVFSDESPRRETPPVEVSSAGGRAKTVNGTISFMPALFGVVLSGIVLQHLLATGENPNGV
ncbi:tRNA threonylcarbamoyladenosine dehydratase [Acidithiobacillus ferrooxidans]|jgi:tRNA A37 threonylcarbamoyladenosine dehydratase|uniref:tRNA threonylcarbamoyladenosine dehydratase n=1 Tax=Acidithiobacillus ferrooxidans TaxID=920 RepID=UPI0013D1DF37|nr:tRNA threonylcarbamoyladenosine dehydratase [Acidithiobacillus ferrooxidans]MBU2858415.1 tRNA threonylcarbamoyladenosine dehydratase [Acidithiobacillus ferrooxidans]MBU2859316.1 tRNA threonylcarbamoyladenosine dehydratase [Acidithiobacillus ferrooxidans]MCR2831308.1 tRNA threonylcarbamoyladenosine dehydratase [Acidithiobacillus ferrooxidans]